MWQNSKVVVAVSGGADSTALLLMLNRLRSDPELTMVAHFNHALRGQESDGDQAFVESLAKKLGLVCVIQRANPDEIVSRSENQLRNARHAFLKRVSKEYNASWVALAHHADDQVETFVHNLLRGSGPSGLGGMATIRPIRLKTNLVRPLLQVTRSEIQQYLCELKQNFRTDSSNMSSDYTRNRIRHELLPVLREFAGSASLDQRLLQTCDLIAKEHDVINDLATQWLEDQVGYFECDLEHLVKHGIQLPLNDCVDTNWAVIRQGIIRLWHCLGWPMREMNYRHWNRLEKLMQHSFSSNHAKKIELPGKIIASYSKGILRIQRTP